MDILSMILSENKANTAIKKIETLEEENAIGSIRESVTLKRYISSIDRSDDTDIVCYVGFAEMDDEIENFLKLLSPGEQAYVFFNLIQIDGEDGNTVLQLKPTLELSIQNGMAILGNMEDMNALTPNTVTLIFDDTGMTVACIAEKAVDASQCRMRVSVSTFRKHIPIDPKYIQGAVLPVVELSTVISEENSFVAMLSEEESAALEALSFSPCIIKFSVDSPNSFGGTLEFSAYADCARPSGADSWGWMAECAQGTFQTMAEDGVWAAVFVVKTAG